MNYIFDYGGTLDTHGNHWGKVIWHAYESVGMPMTEAQFRDAYVYAERTLGRNHIIMPEHTFRDVLRIKLELQFTYLFEEEYISCDDMPLCEQILRKLYDEVCATVGESREVLQELKRRGDSLVLVSNFYGNLNSVLKEFRLDGIFDSLIESAVVGIRKPDPRIFALGVEYLGCQPSDTIVVGDSIDKDIVPAKQLGCTTAWYKGEGWNDDSGVDASAADVIITSLADLLTRKAKQSANKKTQY